MVVDTNVFSADLLRATHGLVELYRPLLAGRRFLISFQTVAEIRFGARRRGWGSARMARLNEHVAHAEVVWPGPALLEVYVDLRVVCERFGHALGQPDHDSDRWIAATAIHLGVPLVSHDGIFRDPGLAFETALPS
ncbi:MAG: PIN domain-containing protein [Acidimicrobiales bacterium]